MKVSPTEFAHTLRGMRPSYKATVRYVTERVEELAADVEKRHKLLARYKDALKVLQANPKKFD